MKTLFQMVAAFVIGFMITATISNSRTPDNWYVVLEFQSTDRTYMLAGPFSSKTGCETHPLAVKFIKAGKDSKSNVKCTNKVPDLQ